MGMSWLKNIVEKFIVESIVKKIYAPSIKVERNQINVHLSGAENEIKKHYRTNIEKEEDRESNRNNKPISTGVTYINNYGLFPNDPKSASAVGFVTRFHKCSACSFGFIFEDNLYSIGSQTFSQKVVACPKCRNAEKIGII